MLVLSSRENEVTHNHDYYIYKKTDLFENFAKRGHQIITIRGVKMGRYSAAHPQYLLSSEYRPPPWDSSEDLYVNPPHLFLVGLKIFDQTI